MNKDNKVFCILPWIHTHLNTEGDVFPCCVSWTPQRESRVGWLKDNSLEELFNNDFMKQLRLDMLEGKERPDVCSNCYDREDSGFQSARQGYNRDHKKDLPIVEDTAEDGYIEPIIKSWDIRFSNLCNMKCRSCGPLFSTTWAQEKKEFANIKIQAIDDNAPDPLLRQYDNVEKIYFAGGEPLIMPEHFNTLKELISRNRAKNIELIYNSNMSKLDYNKNEILSYWKQFKKVVVGVSADAVGPRAEYIRNGIKWNTIEANLAKLMQFKQQCKSFDFYYSPTVGVLNIFHITDMHQYLWTNNLMPNINAINFNLLLYPKHYEFKILPDNIKKIIIEKIKCHENWLKENDATVDTINNYINLRNNLLQDVGTVELENFFRITKQLDSIRKESFVDVFPEYAEMYLSQNVEQRNNNGK
tara:strand:+ start:2695 stop:3939 length:1245 start_codon:yes stop_codon:yes gene_type:complete